MSVLQTLSHRLVGKPMQLSLVAGLCSSSYFFYANLGAAYCGIAPAIRDLKLPVATKVALWKYLYDRAKIHMAGCTMVSTISFSAAAFLSTSPSLRNLLLGTAAMSFAITPWTLITMMPVNNELDALHKGLTLQATLAAEESAEDKRALQCLDKWRELHRVRFALGMGVWIAAVTALIVSV